MQANLVIQVSDIHRKNETFTVEEMVALADQRLTFKIVYPPWREMPLISKRGTAAGKARGSMRDAEEPTHVKVEAVDEFQALMPWSQVDQALFYMHRKDNR